MIKENQEFLILQTLAQADHPLGSGLLKELLTSQGHELSEATAGRLLRELDHKGYTEKLGFRGRRITVAGRARLEELGQKQAHRNYGEQLIAALNLGGKQDLIELLVARRAIESELARLAAASATREEIAELKAIVREQDAQLRRGFTGAQQDVEFHRTVAAASRNKVLQAAMDLIRHNGQLSPVLEEIRRQVKSALVDDHLQILGAIADRDQEKAYQAMRRHIEGLIGDVEKYWG